MPRPKNTFLRTLVPVLGLILIAVVGWAVFRNSGTTTPPAVTPPAPANSTEAKPAAPAQAVAAPPAAVPASTPPAAAAPVSVPVPGYPEIVEGTSPAELTLGSLADDDRARIEFSSLGAGVASWRLARHFEAIGKETHVEVQRQHLLDPADPARSPALVPMALLGVEINGVYVDLLRAAGGRIWRPVEGTPGAFEAFIRGAQGGRIARVYRRYEPIPGGVTLRLTQRVENLTDAPMKIRWFQLGPVDLDPDEAGYVGDKRRVRFGYLLSPGADPARQSVTASDFLTDRVSVLGTPDAQGRHPFSLPQWPNAVGVKQGYELVWAGLTNRYFGVAVFPLIEPAAGAPADKAWRWVGGVERLVVDGMPQKVGPAAPVMALRLSSVPLDVPAHASLDLSHGVFAGALSKPPLQADPLTARAGVDGLVVYTLGGPCAWCTFSSLTGALLWLLRTLHNYVVFDWALSIVLLVIIVRLVLHPVTRWSQIRMTRFGKQMQALGPKQAKLKEKYGNDPKQFQAEMAKLWREEGISPTGALGCLPMFLQMPVWIALYATLFFAAELRHQGAFFGLFQALGLKTFLADLAEPDRFIYFGREIVNLPLLGSITSLNLLPLILGVVFFIQQKYLTPPSAPGSLTPEQEMQQKMMKWMTVVLFPLLMYNAPAGLALYFIVNSTVGILESRSIRASINANDLAGPNKPGGGPKQEGFFARLQRLAAEQQKLAQERAKQQAKQNRKKR